MTSGAGAEDAARIARAREQAASAPEYAGDPAPEPWGDPSPLTGWAEPPAFLPGYLPEPLAGMVAAVAEELQLPAAVPGLSALSVAALALARVIEVQVKPGWREPVNLYTVSVLPSGNRKSACDAKLAAPVREFERERREAMRDEIAQAKEARAQAEERLKSIRRLLSGVKSDAGRMVRQ